MESLQSHAGDHRHYRKWAATETEEHEREMIITFLFGAHFFVSLGFCYVFNYLQAIRTFNKVTKYKTNITLATNNLKFYLDKSIFNNNTIKI